MKLQLTIWLLGALWSLVFATNTTDKKPYLPSFLVGSPDELSTPATYKYDLSSVDHDLRDGAIAKPEKPPCLDLPPGVECSMSNSDKCVRNPQEALGYTPQLTPSLVYQFRMPNDQPVERTVQLFTKTAGWYPKMLICRKDPNTQEWKNLEPRSNPPNSRYTFEQNQTYILEIGDINNNSIEQITSLAPEFIAKGTEGKFLVLFAAADCDILKPFSGQTFTGIDPKAPKMNYQCQLERGGKAIGIEDDHREDWGTYDNSLAPYYNPDGPTVRFFFSEGQPSSLMEDFGRKNRFALQLKHTASGKQKFTGICQKCPNEGGLRILSCENNALPDCFRRLKNAEGRCRGMRNKGASENGNSASNSGNHQSEAKREQNNNVKSSNNNNSDDTKVEHSKNVKSNAGNSQSSKKSGSAAKTTSASNGAASPYHRPWMGKPGCRLTPRLQRLVSNNSSNSKHSSAGKSANNGTKNVSSKSSGHSGKAKFNRSDTYTGNGRQSGNGKFGKSGKFSGNGNHNVNSNNRSGNGNYGRKSNNSSQYGKANSFALRGANSKGLGLQANNGTNYNGKISNGNLNSANLNNNPRNMANNGNYSDNSYRNSNNDHYSNNNSNDYSDNNSNTYFDNNSNTYSNNNSNTYFDNNSNDYSNNNSNDYYNNNSNNYSSNNSNNYSNNNSNNYSNNNSNNYSNNNSNDYYNNNSNNYSSNNSINHTHNVNSTNIQNRNSSTVHKNSTTNEFHLKNASTGQSGNHSVMPSKMKYRCKPYIPNGNGGVPNIPDKNGNPNGNNPPSKDPNNGDADNPNNSKGGNNPEDAKDSDHNVFYPKDTDDGGSYIDDGIESEQSKLPPIQDKLAEISNDINNLALNIPDMNTANEPNSDLHPKNKLYPDLSSMMGNDNVETQSTDSNSKGLYPDLSELMDDDNYFNQSAYENKANPTYSSSSYHHHSQYNNNHQTQIGFE